MGCLFYRALQVVRLPKLRARKKEGRKEGRKEGERIGDSLAASLQHSVEGEQRGRGPLSQRHMDSHQENASIYERKQIDPIFGGKTRQTRKSP